MKICDLTQFYSPVSGGVRRYLQEKVAYLRRQPAPHEHVLIIPGERTARESSPGSKVYTIASPLLSRTSRYRALLNLNAVEEILEREHPDIIESGDPYQVAWKALASGRALRIPVVGFYHSHFPEAYLRSAARHFGKTAADVVMDLAARYVRAVYGRFSRTLVPSEALAQVLRGWGVDRAVPIDLGVDLSTFHPAEIGAEKPLRAELGIPGDRLLLLYVGRLAGEKNTTTLFDAFALLAARHPGQFHLLAVGDGLQRPRLLKLREETGAVTWMEYCADSRRLADLYRSADLFVHPGVQETFGLVTLESQACGVPVIGIRGSYMDRIIFNDQTGWATKNSPEALADAIAQMAGRDLPALGQEAARRVAARYSWDAVFDRLLAVYREAIAEAAP